MIKITQVILRDFYAETDALIKAVDEKVFSKLVSPVNSDIKKDLEIKTEILAELLITIESKLRRCQEIYHTYFETVDHNALMGISPTSSLEFNFEFILNSLGQTKNVSVKINDLAIYNEIIHTNFQFYVLSIASLYENLVFLVEMLLKKTIVHPPGIKVHPSTPLLLLINYRKVLISLDYRTKDDFYDCIDSYTEYFDEFLPAIHSLRNSFIHGFRTNLAPDGARYRITKQDIKVKNTGNLELDVFTGEININTLNFVRDLLICLTKMVKNSKTVIPV